MGLIRESSEAILVAAEVAFASWAVILKNALDASLEFRFL
jgi:hypothetical protein